MSNFDKLNNYIVFAMADSRKAALSLHSKAVKEVEIGKSAVIFFNSQYHLKLAPGHDPYKVRRDISEWVELQEKKAKAAEEKESSDSSSKTSSKNKKSSKVQVEDL